MSEETKSFKNQLEEIREHLEKCKLERLRRHLEFERRVNDIKARHERLTTGRIRRLSFEGILVDLDKIKSHRQDCGFDGKEANEGRYERLTKCIRRETTDSALMYHKTSDKHTSEECVPNLIERNVEKQPFKQLRLEFAFDSNISSTFIHTQTKKLKNKNEYKNTRTKSTVNLKHIMQDKSPSKSKLQTAFNKVLRVQRFTSQRRHTILSMAPLDIGKKSKLPTAITCDQVLSQPLRQNTGTINLTSQEKGSTNHVLSEYQKKSFKEQSRR